MDWLYGAVIGCIIGAVAGAIGAALTGGDVGKGVIFGAIAGAVTGGISGWLAGPVEAGASGASGVALDSGMSTAAEQAANVGVTTNSGLSATFGSTGTTGIDAAGGTALSSGTSGLSSVGLDSSLMSANAGTGANSFWGSLFGNTVGKGGAMQGLGTSLVQGGIGIVGSAIQGSAAQDAAAEAARQKAKSDSELLAQKLEGDKATAELSNRTNMDIAGMSSADRQKALMENARQFDVTAAFNKQVYDTNRADVEAKRTRAGGALAQVNLERTSFLPSSAPSIQSQVAANSTGSSSTSSGIVTGIPQLVNGQVVYSSTPGALTGTPTSVNGNLVYA